MDEEDAIPSHNFVPCVKWVRRGVAESRPVKVELSKQELDEVIRQTRANLRVNDDEGDSGTENDDISPDANDEASRDPSDEFSMETYDDEGNDVGLDVSGVVAVEAEDGYNAADDDVDSEEEDDVIKPSDNLIVVGHVEGDASILEIYVYNEEEGSLYVHHDLLLPSIPLAMEWLNYDPDNVNTPGNLCAVGSMDPIIQVWDLDLVNCIEPAYKLGRKRSRKKGLPVVGHTDAVLDLAWNTSLTHILASGSVDQRVLLWDLEVKAPNTELKRFQEKVQTLTWHPVEGQTLLTGCADKTCKVWDCRTSDTFKSWLVAGEVERACWCHGDLYSFVASDDTGFIHYIDTRSDQPLWSFKAHDDAVTGLHVSPVYPGLLVSVAQSGMMKVWDVTPGGGTLIAEKALKIGQTQCLDVAPEAPFTVAAGGDNRSHNFVVQSLIDIEAVKTRFGSRTPMSPPAVEGVATPGPSTVRVREKRPRSADRALNVKKKSKNFGKPKK